MILVCGEWGLRELEMENHFRFCKKFGFRLMEIGVGGVIGQLKPTISDREIHDFNRMRHRYGIQTPYCLLENDFTLADEREHQRQMKTTIKQLYLSKQLEAKMVRLFSGFTPASQITKAIWNRMLSALNVCLDLCRDLDLAITVETHGQMTITDGIYYHAHTISTHRDWLKRFLDETPEEIGICYDPANIIALEQGDRFCALDVVRDRINYVHLKDWLRSGKGWSPASLGNATMDYETLLPRIAEVYNGPYCIEYEATEDVEDGFRRCIDYLKSTGQKVEF